MNSLVAVFSLDEDFMQYTATVCVWERLVGGASCIRNFSLLLALLKHIISVQYIALTNKL